MRPKPHYRRATAFAILVISLVTVCAFLTGLLYVLFAKAASAEPRQQAFLARLAWLTGAVLVLTLVILIGVVIHYIFSRFREPAEKFKPLGYVDAWTEGGRRLKAEDAPPVEPFEQE